MTEPKSEMAPEVSPRSWRRTVDNDGLSYGCNARRLPKQRDAAQACRFGRPAEELIL